MRVLVCNLKEVHQMFRAQNSHKVSFSTECITAFMIAGWNWQKSVYPKWTYLTRQPCRPARMEPNHPYDACECTADTLAVV